MKINIKKEKRKQYCRLHTLSIKLFIFQIYSNGTMKCKKCGYDNVDALSIDHINNNGAEHRKRIGILNGGQEFYMWLIKNKFPSGYQVLCLNCQMIKKLRYLK
jgi:hypothetical protein